MKSMTIRTLLFAAAGAIGLFQGCQTPTPKETTPLSEAQLKAFLGHARDARTFWITVYQSENGPIFAGANRLHPEQVARLPFRSASEYTTPIIRLGSLEVFDAVIDTSSRENWMDFSTGRDLHATPLAPVCEMKPEHVKDNIPGYISVVSNLRFDELDVENAVVCMRGAFGPLGPLSRYPGKSQPECVIGCDMLRSFQVAQIDYPARVVVLSSGADYTPDTTNLIATVPLQEVAGAFAGDGVVDGEPKTVIIDSAGDFEFAMSNPPTNVLRQVSIGDLVFRKVNVVSLSELDLGLPNYPRIGNKLLSRFKVTFAPKRRLVYFERPAP